MTRAHNFSAGPSALPLPVLEQAASELVDFRGNGASLLELSHRGPAYLDVHAECVADLRTLLGAPDDYSIFFMGGGARTQFALLPLNLRPTGTAGYLTTGTWSEGAIEEARKLGPAQELYSSAASKHNHVPHRGDYEVPDDLAYLHYTSNNTIYGTQFHEIPEHGAAPLVCDMSSDILHGPVDVRRFAMIYAGAQKNLGPAGVTVLVVRKDMLARSRADLPELFSYKLVAGKDSMLNTPPVYAIYLVGLVAKHLIALGGAAAALARNQRKARLLHDAIDDSGGFWRGHARADSRSLMNVTFRGPSAELEARFVREAEAEAFIGLEGHRSVGGLRASIYNAVPLESVQALVAFMDEFRRRNG